MTEESFKLEVVTGLTELRGDVRAIRDHLVVLNGQTAKNSAAVTEHEAKIAEQKILIAAENAKSNLAATSDVSTRAQIAAIHLSLATIDVRRKTLNGVYSVVLLLLGGLTEHFVKLFLR